MTKECAIFLVSGSDTAVGKTVFTGLLGQYIKNIGFRARLAKPFCSGGRKDIQFLAECAAVDEREINYWYHNEPISPATWELRTGKRVDFMGSVKWVKKLEESFKGQGESGVLLVEGVGGLLAPLDQVATVASLGQALGSQLILVVPNRVGAVNHVLLNTEAALGHGLSVACIVLMQLEEPDESAIDNAKLMQIHLPKMADFKGIFEFPWLGEGADDSALNSVNLKKAEGVLEVIFDECILPILGHNTSVT